MAVERIGMRLTVAEQVSRRQEFRGRGLALEVRGVRGFGTRATEVLSHLPALLTAKGVEVRAYTPLGLELNVVNLVGRTAGEIDSMAAQIDALSRVASVRAPKPKIEMIDDSRLSFLVEKGVTRRTSLLDGRARAEKLNRQNPGRNFRVPRDGELFLVDGFVGDQLDGRDFFVWTETPHERYSGEFVLRLMDKGKDIPIHERPETRSNSFAVRLVADRV